MLKTADAVKIAEYYESSSDWGFWEYLAIEDIAFLNPKLMRHSSVVELTAHYEAELVLSSTGNLDAPLALLRRTYP